MSACIVYQGRPGAFSEIAARRVAGAARLSSCRRFADVIDAVTRNAATLGILPIRNSLAGVIAEACMLIARAPIVVLDEITLPISHALIALPGADFHELQRVLSHPVALRQCSRFFRRHAWLKAVPAEDTAGSVETLVAQKPPWTAAIASAHAAELYGAAIVADRIEDSPANRTTFVLIARF